MYCSLKDTGRAAIILDSGAVSRGSGNQGSSKEKDIPWVKTGEVDYKRIMVAEEYITKTGLENSSAKLFPSGTLLVAMYGQGITRGKVGIYPPPTSAWFRTTSRLKST